MSVKYDEYLEQHIANVNKAAKWLCEKFPDIEETLGVANCVGMIFPAHDDSKRSAREYEAYDDYFYGRNRSYSVVKAFNYAWLHHIHSNPHHWQHWVLMHDDEPEEILEMPFKYVIEMICDWWSFSFAKGNLDEIFEWYEAHKDMKLHPNTRKQVESILSRISMELGITTDGSLKHHGIIGQKWGVRNGPPYPIKGFQSVNELFNQTKSINYKQFDRLMSADEVGRTQTGSCHDQTMYVLQQLRRMGKDPHGLFVMELNDGQGGMTHSFAYYVENGKTHWFEPANTWPGRSGDHEYDSLDAIKSEIAKAHSTGEFGNKREYGDIIFGEFDDSKHEIGEDLGQLVDTCLAETDDVYKGE